MLIKDGNSQEDTQFSLPLDIFAIISFICTAFYIYFYAILIKFESFPLHSFQQRVIGIAVLEGVDVVARTKLFLYALILTGILALLLLVVLEKIMDRFFPKKDYKKERFFLGLISILGTTNLIFGIFTKQSVFLFNIYLIICLICSVLTLIAAKKYTWIKNPQSVLIFDDFGVITTLFLLPITGIFALLVLKGDSFAITPTIFILYYIVFFIMLSFLTAFSVYGSPRVFDEKFRAIAVNSLLPLYFYPVSIPLANEFQYWLSQWAVVHPGVLSLGFLVVLICAGFILYKIQAGRGSFFLNPLSAHENFSFPALLAAFILYGKYLLNTTFNSVAYKGNLMEFGFTSTIIQQLFDFGKIPNIHLVAPHGLSDIYFACLYSIFNGYQPVDSFTWNWITPVLVVLLGYFLLKEFVEGHVAFLLMIFLPLYGILQFNDYFFILIPAILFIRFWNYPKLINYTLVLISILVCFIWRVEVGVAALLAFFLLSILLYSHIFKRTLSQVWKDYSIYLYTTIGLLGVCILLYVVVCVITGISPISAVQSVINLYSIQEARGTYPSLFINYDARVVLEYAVLPLFCLGILIFFIWAAFNRKKNLSAQFILIAFIAIGTLFLAQRATQRHSLVEGFSYYYYPLIACLVPLAWYRAKRYLSIIVLILLLGTGFLVIHYPLVTIHNNYSNNFFEFKTWENHETRIQIQESDIKSVASLTEYLQEHLQSDETYYDMSNLILPYTLLRKEYIPNSLFHMIQTGDYYQNETIKRLIQNQDRIPVVVTGGGQMDNIPNELRTYRISEYVFTHYKPIGKIGIFEIWIRNDLNESDFVGGGSEFSDGDTYRIPFSTSDSVTHDLTYQTHNNEIVIKSGSIDPYFWNFLLFNSSEKGYDVKNTGFHLVYTSDTGGSLQLFYSLNHSRFSEKNSVRGTITKSANHDQVYYVVIPANIRDITDIRIDPPNNSNITLKSVELYPQNSSLTVDRTLGRRYDLKQLPYIWAEFDAANPAINQPVQEIVFHGEYQIPADVPFIMSTTHATLDKSSGNYLLVQLISGSKGTVTINYGNSPDDFAQATLNFNTISSDNKQNYLIRISSQWDWYSTPVDFIELNSTVPITLYECKILKGD
jgi:hypothetical protein